MSYTAVWNPIILWISWINIQADVQYLYTGAEIRSRCRPPGTGVLVIPPARRGHCSWTSPRTWRWNCALLSVLWQACRGRRRTWLQRWKCGILLMWLNRRPTNPTQMFPQAFMQQCITLHCYTFPPVHVGVDARLHCPIFTIQIFISV